MGDISIFFNFLKISYKFDTMYLMLHVLANRLKQHIKSGHSNEHLCLMQYDEHGQILREKRLNHFIFAGRAEDKEQQLQNAMGR